MTDLLLVLLFFSGCAAVTMMPLPTASPTPEIIIEPMPTSSPSPLVTFTPTASPSPSFTVNPEPSTIPSPKPSPSPLVQAHYVTVPPGDIGPSLTKAKAGDYLQLMTGKAYSLNSSIILMPAQSHVTLDLGGNAVPFHNSPGSGSNIVVKGAYFTLRNGRITLGNTPAIRSQADHTTIEDLSTQDITWGADGKQNGGVTQLFLGDHDSTNALIQRVKMGRVGTVGIYITQDNFTLRESQLGCSVGEYSFRSEIIALPAVPKNIMIDHITCDSSCNVNGKSCLGFRMGGFTLQNSVIHGYVIAGQSNAPSLGFDNPAAIVKNNVFTGTRDPQLSINAGSIATIEGNTFQRFETPYPPIAIDRSPTTTANLINNTMKLTNPAIKPHGLWGTQPNSFVKESGTKTQ